MLNAQIDRLTDYPFQRLRELLDDAALPAGVAPILMYLGEPQHAAPAMVTETIVANAHLWNKYPLIDGTPEWREACWGWLRRRYALAESFLDPHRQILPVSGSREGLYVIASLVVPRRKGDATPLALIPNPFYQVYVAGAVMAGAEPVFVPATRERGFLPDLAGLGARTLDKVAIAYLCSPSNPQGAVADLEYLKRAVRLARRHDFVLAVDECYAEIYNDAPPPGALEACQALGGGLENVVVFHTLSKRSSVPGLRSGFVVGDPRLMHRFKTLRSYASPTLPIPILAASAALWRDDEHARANRELYRAKFDLAGQVLGARFGYERPAGGFFLWLNVGDGEGATRRLWSEAGVRVLPGRYLTREDEQGVNPGAGYIRVALVHDLDTVAEALRRIVKVL